MKQMRSRLFVVLLGLWVFAGLPAQAHLKTQEQRDSFVIYELPKRKQACDEKLKKGDSGVTVEMREASEDAMVCMRSLVTDTAKALYFEEDLASQNFPAELARLEKGLLSLYGVTDAMALYCGSSSDNECTHSGGTMYLVTPYGPVLDAYESLLLRMADMSLSDPEAVMTPAWKASLHRHSDSEE